MIVTRFMKDCEAIKNDPFEAREILERRQRELDKLEREGKTCKNSFRLQCIVQDFTRLKREYNELDALV